MFSLLLICVGIGFASAEHGESVTRADVQITDEIKRRPNMITRLPEDTLTSSPHLPNRTKERDDDDDDDDDNDEGDVDSVEGASGADEIIPLDNENRGFAIKPSNAFPLSNMNDPVIFNCTSTTMLLPLWTMHIVYNSRRWMLDEEYPITNTACEVITLIPRYRFRTETLGPGSCNLIVDAYEKIYSFIFSCTDSTLSSSKAILVPINLEPRIKIRNSLTTVTDIKRDDELRISCNPAFLDSSSTSSSKFLVYGWPGARVVRVDIVRTYWTSLEDVVSSYNTSRTSSYVLLKAPKAGVIPRYTCNIVCTCNLIGKISNLRANSTIEFSISTNPVDILYWPTEENMTITDDNKSQIRALAVLTCYAAANPPATYEWTDESTGEITKGAKVVINHSGNFTCNASNVIRGKTFHQSKLVYWQIVEDETPQNLPVLILLGVAVSAIIIILAILLIRICRQKERTTDNGKDYELPQRGEEGNLYEAGLRNDTHVVESGSDQPEAPQRDLLAILSIYDEIVHDNGHDFLNSEENNLHEDGLGSVLDASESEYDNIDDSPQRLSSLSGIYNELEFDKYM